MEESARKMLIESLNSPDLIKKAISLLIEDNRNLENRITHLESNVRSLVMLHAPGPGDI